MVRALEIGSVVILITTDKFTLILKTWLIMVLVGRTIAFKKPNNL